MNLEEAKELLNKCDRIELRDHAFGDTEVDWINKELDPHEVGWGYFGSQGAHVAVRSNGTCTDFIREDAQALRSCGTAYIHRNDETGPDEYQEGITMPGLTLDGVRKELTDECYDEQGNAHIRGRCDECGAPVGEDGCSTNTDHKV